MEFDICQYNNDIRNPKFKLPLATLDFQIPPEKGDLVVVSKHDGRDTFRVKTRVFRPENEDRNPQLGVVEVDGREEVQ